MFPKLSRNQIKFIRSLKQKKYRYKLQKYAVEGEKQIRDIMKFSPRSIDHIVIAQEFSDQSQWPDLPVYAATESEFRELSSMTHPQGILAVCKIPESYVDAMWNENGFALYCDGIQDPGNLGTMLRAAEWFGIDQVLIGPETVDPFSPKVVQAAMGSLTYIDLFSCSHESLCGLDCPILVADMEGQDAYQFEWPQSGILVLSNEGRGVSDFFRKQASVRITLPSLAASRTESLNVSMACTALLTLRAANS